MAKNVVSKNWSGWIRASDGYLRSDDPYGTYGTYVPTLPQTYLTTTYSLPSGNTWTATNTSNSSVAGTGTGNRTDCSLQYAIDNCALNDVIQLTAGSTYAGPFTLKNKVSGSGWIYIVSTGIASLPAYGEATANRVAIADATYMPTITGTAAANAINTEQNAHHYRLVGLHIKPLPGDFVYSLCSIGNNDTSLGTQANNIGFDRCYIHGDPTLGGRRGIMLNGPNCWAVSCYISDFKEDGADSQAILTTNSPGPLKIVNNYLEAAGENFMAGGSDPTITNLVPADIEIRHNHFYKPTAWIPLLWDIKNHLELKNARRVLIEGNKFENVWAADQSGYSLLITPRNQDGAGTWCTCKDITIRLNKFINIGQGMTIAGRDGNFLTNDAAQVERVLVENNVLEITGLNNSEGRGFQGGNGPWYLTIQHNTIIITASNGNNTLANYTNNSPYLGKYLRFRDNVASHGNYGFIGDGKSPTTSALAFYWQANFMFDYNAIIGGSGYPTNNQYPADNAAVGFTNFAGGNYTLTGGSAYHNAASDGTDMGCDIAALNAAIA